MPLILDHDDISGLLTMEAAVGVLREAHVAKARGQAVLTERSNLMLPEGWMRMAPAALLDQRSVTGFKEFHLSPKNELRFEIRLFDYTTGACLASMDGRLITGFRTGATGGVAISVCTPESASSVGVIGSGETAFYQLEAAASVRPLSSVKVYSRSADRRSRFAAAMEGRLGVLVTPVDEPLKAVRDTDILIAATDTGGSGAAVLGDWFHPGLHVNSIGSTLPNQRELDTRCFARADSLIVDTMGVLRDSGDAIAATGSGDLEEDRVVELATVVTGDAEARRNANEITLFKSIGTALQDVALAHWVYEEAARRGAGQQTRDHISVKPN